MEQSNTSEAFIYHTHKSPAVILLWFKWIQFIRVKKHNSEIILIQYFTFTYF
jgi:hypothetical protein